MTERIRSCLHKTDKKGHGWRPRPIRERAHIAYRLTHKDIGLAGDQRRKRMRRSACDCDIDRRVASPCAIDTLRG